MADQDSRVWIEIDDFLRMFDWAITPAGIGRVQMEIIPRLLWGFPDRVALFRAGRSEEQARIIANEYLLRLIEESRRISADSRGSRYLVRVGQFRRLINRWAHEQLERLPKGQKALRNHIRSGDIVVNFGATWERRDYFACVGELKRRHGVRLAFLVHDILPVTHPQLVAKGHIPNFVRWLDETASVWDVVMTPSRYSAESLEAYLKEHGRPVPPISAIPYGAGINLAKSQSAPKPLETQPYVLLTSTIEVRKNHLFLVHIWKRLIDKYGADRVPVLLFAGKFGWEIDDLKTELARTGNLGGKIRLHHYLSDAEIDRAYRDSLITAFPSHCEGWGLPVSESLSHGKLCVASNATSIPEAGGPFADYFPPDDADAACAVIERAIFDDAYRADRERNIAENYKKPSWEGTAEFVMQLLTSHDDSAAPHVGALQDGGSVGT